MRFSRSNDYYVSNLVNKNCQNIEQQQDELEIRIDKLIHQLQTGTPTEKHVAADQLGLLGADAILATDALVSALSDFEVDTEFISDFGFGNIYWYRYVRESAVEALAKVNPSAAAPLALQVIEELKKMTKERRDRLDGEPVETFVTIPEKTIAIFQLATNRV